MSATPPAGTRWYALGALIGLLASGILVGGWHRGSSELSITVLGGGRQAAVLITFDHRRILLAAGTNGTDFSNALANALPPVDKELDLILIDPSSSLEVQERARALDASVIWTLPHPDEPRAADTIERPFTIQVDDDTRLAMTVTPEQSWQAMLTAPAGSVLIAPILPFQSGTRPTAALILLHDADMTDVGPPLVIGVPGLLATTGSQLRTVGPGSTLRLDVLANEIRLRSD